MSEELTKLKHAVEGAADKIIDIGYHWELLDDFERETIDDIARSCGLDDNFEDTIANLRKFSLALHNLTIIDGYQVNIFNGGINIIVHNRDYEVHTFQRLEYIMEQEHIPTETALKIVEFYLERS